MNLFTNARLLLVFGWGIALCVPVGVGHAGTLLWEADHSGGGVVIGAQVNSGTNAWWNSSSPMTRFSADGGQVSVLMEPGHELTNQNGISLGSGFTGYGILELLVRSEEAMTLGLAANWGEFSLLEGGESAGTLLVPGVEAGAYTWLAFSWVPGQVVETFAAGRSSEPVETQGDENLMVTVFTLDSDLFIAGARFTAFAVPEPGRIGLFAFGLFVAGWMRRRKVLN
jgi:hypothetical protein